MDSEIRRFADDCVCYREIKGTGDTVKLQEDIDEPRHEKTCFSHMRTTKAQIRLRIAQSDQHHFCSLPR